MRVTKWSFETFLVTPVYPNIPYFLKGGES